MTCLDFTIQATYYRLTILFSIGGFPFIWCCAIFYHVLVCGSNSIILPIISYVTFCKYIRTQEAWSTVGHPPSCSQQPPQQLHACSALDDSDDSLQQSLSAAAAAVVTNGHFIAGGGHDRVVDTDAHLISLMESTISEINSRGVMQSANETEVPLPSSIVANAPISIRQCGGTDLHDTTQVKPAVGDSCVAEGINLTTQSQQQQPEKPTKKSKKLCQSNSTFYVPVNELADTAEE